MTQNDLREFCRALDITWPATLAQLDEARRLQSQVWHPDRYQHNEKLRLKGEEKLKRINHAYERLSEYVRGGGGSVCTSCGEPFIGEGEQCDACQRHEDLERREREIRRRERAVREREVERERQAARPRFVDVAGRWTSGFSWIEFHGSSPEYQYIGGGVIGQTETGTATVSGNRVDVRAYNALFGHFEAMFTADGRRLVGVVRSAMGSGNMEFWKS
jgi:hypothetical protein